VLFTSGLPNCLSIASSGPAAILVDRIRLINDQLADTGRQADRLCKKLSEPVADEEGWQL
jgi:hypothetical protein